MARRTKIITTTTIAKITRMRWYSRAHEVFPRIVLHRRSLGFLYGAPLSPLPNFISTDYFSADSPTQPLRHTHTYKTHPDNFPLNIITLRRPTRRIRRRRDNNNFRAAHHHRHPLSSSNDKWSLTDICMCVCVCVFVCM